MKIIKVKWKDHPILGNLELDFTNPISSLPYETIIFAGENGTGKTTILDTISTFLNIGIFEFIEVIEYIVEGKVYKATPETDAKYFYKIIDENGNDTVYPANKNNNQALNVEDKKDIRHYGCSFSNVKANYKTKKITSITTKSLDIEKYDNDQEDDINSLKQLIVDIQNQDNTDYAELNKSLGSSPITWEEFFVTSKTNRFKNAFDTFFNNLKFYKVINKDSEKVILFKKDDNEISIDELSSGEKQIVFRGIHLLKNIKKLDGAAIMVDEPELSMHPKWQKNILTYYQDLFSESNVQNAQLLIASHSEHVISRALKDRSRNLVVVLTEDEGSISPKRITDPIILPSITSAETNYLAYDLISIDYHIELYGFLQHKMSKEKVKKFDNYIINQSEYDPSRHEKTSEYNRTKYKSLSTYIRNAIHYPKPDNTFTEKELRTSIELLIKLCEGRP